MTSSDLENLCMSFEGTTRDIKWGNDLCYSICKKMFCVTSLEGMKYVSFKTTPEDFGELIEEGRIGIIDTMFKKLGFNYLILILFF